MPGGHAGVAETAQVIYFDDAKKQIRRDKYAASAAGPEPAAGVLVDPTPATAEMGRMFVDFKVAAAVEQIQAAADAEVGRRQAAPLARPSWVSPGRLRLPTRDCGSTSSSPMPDGSARARA